ncbi:capsule assembly Wzi family protein [Pseudoalteromonas sp. SWXJZ94C]|uniref:capsule assembly Wzi family protein n=1 Tax=unclassified Pseudoalteromonas TaxID=194690 RepID=UPI00140A8363|nr:MULTISPECIES: capsule assembly Wzi family protein [unclassified Pseudoalteromonas]MBH0059036.1 capsule assembly Wzi family protein [Pseudoalteromonas sp. SWXJZ94C]
MRNRIFLLSSIFCAISVSANAEPWVKPDDYGLRADIQQLADAGIILAPVTTYPLMWKSFMSDVDSTSLEQLSPSLQDALLRVKHRYKSENSSSHNVQLSAFAATDPIVATSFGATNTQESELSAAYAYLGDNFAAKIAINYRDDGKKCLVEGKTADDIITDEQALTDCNDTSLDDSYLAYRLGNWIFRAGAVEQFWGPGVDNSLIMSGNAKPLPALSVTREQSTAFETPWLSWIGQWGFTAQMAKLESTRVVPDALLWSTRVNFRPIQQLEVALSWSAQWAGDGQPGSAGDFIDVITGQTACVDGNETCDSQLESKIGNQLAGLDIRWSDTLFNQPYAVYASTIGEDASSQFKPADRAYLFGVQTTQRMYNQNVLVNLEYTDTGVSCSAGSTTENCYYEHSDYKSGYRYHGRTIGSTYDNDAQSVVLTLLGQLSSGDDWQVKLRSVDYNSDNRDRYPNNPDLGNSITKTGFNSKQLELRYRLITMSGRLTLGAFASNNDDVDNDTSAFAKYEYNF